VSAVAIVDVSGKLIGDFSARDLRGVMSHKTFFELDTKLTDVLSYHNVMVRKQQQQQQQNCCRC
jgi:CBS domain-containing protein